MPKRKRKSRGKRAASVSTKRSSALFSSESRPAGPLEIGAPERRDPVRDLGRSRRLFYLRRTHKDVIPGDRRFYNLRNSALLLSGIPAEYTLSDKPPVGSRGTLARVAFKKPKFVNVCVRRRRRRESLFALGHAGKGKKIFGKRKWSIFSDIKC